MRKIFIYFFQIINGPFILNVSLKSRKNVSVSTDPYDLNKLVSLVLNLSFLYLSLSCNTIESIIFVARAIAGNSHCYDIIRYIHDEKALMSFETCCIMVYDES